MSTEKKYLIENVERGYGTGKGKLEIDPVPGPSGTSGNSGTNVVKYGKAEKWPQYCAALSSTLGAFALGAVLGWISPAVARITTAYGFPVNNVELSWIGSLVFLGMATIVGFMDWILTKFGRKNTMLLLLIPYTIGWLFIIFATNLTAIYIGRFITGFASGGFCVTTPLYIAEIAQKEIRGSLGTMYPIMITVGILFAYIVGTIGTLLWLSISSLAIPLLLGFIFFFQPESPLYLVRKNQMDEARRALIQLRGRNFDVDSELREIVASEENFNPNESGLWQSLKKRATQKALLIAAGTMGIQQLTGLYPIMSYSTIILQTTGAGTTTVTAGAVIIFLGVIQLLGNLIGEAVVDTRGRKYLLTRSAIWMAISLLFLGLYFKFRFYYAVYTSAFNNPFIPLLIISIYAIAYSVGFGPIPWVIVGEIFPPAVKNKAAGIALIINLICSFLVTQYFIEMIQVIGRDGTFYIFALICVLGALFVHFVVIETKGKSLNEIQNELENEGHERL